MEVPCWAIAKVTITETVRSLGLASENPIGKLKGLMASLGYSYDGTVDGFISLS